MRMDGTPIHVLTLQEALKETVAVLFEYGLDNCKVMLIDMDAAEILYLSESNLSLRELCESYNEGNILFVRKDT